MIRRRILSVLAILAAVIITVQGFATTVFARSDSGITDISAPSDNSGVLSQDEPDNDPSLPKSGNEAAPVREREDSLYTKTTDNGDGTKTLEVYGTPVRYRTEDGYVKDISLTPVKDGTGYRTGDHYIGIAFPEKAGAGISIDNGGYEIVLTPLDGTGNAVNTESAYLSDTGAVVYRKDSKTSYEYSITYSGYKETIVISEYTGQTDYLFRLGTGGLKLSAPNGDLRGEGLTLIDRNGNSIARISDIIVFTSDNRNNTFGEISYETVKEDSEYILRISLSAGYLSDPDTHYPIYIDPTITVAYDANASGTWNDIEDITVNQNHATDSPTSGTLYIGKAGASYGAMRTVMRFPEMDLYGILPANITSAVVHVRDLMCYAYSLQVDCYGYYGTLPTGSFTQTNMTWSGVYGTMQYYESGGAYRSSNIVCYNNGLANGHWYEFSILPAVQSWAQSQNSSSSFSTSQQAIAFKSTDSYEASSNEHYVCIGSYDRASYKPYLTIVYTEQQNNSITLNPGSLNLLVGNGYSLSAQTTPSGQTVTWTSSNPAVATVSSYGYVHAHSTGSATITASAGGASATCTVAVGALNGVYRIQNLDIYWTNSTGGYLTDNTYFPILSSYNSQSRNQLWLIKNISGTSRYTLNPLSKTTIDYSGTDIGLSIGIEEEIPYVLIGNISNSSEIFNDGQWYITGDEDIGYSICSYSSGDYSILTQDGFSNVKLECDENLIDEEYPIDKWIITNVDMQLYSPLSSSVNSISAYQDSRLLWLPYISATNTSAAEQRIQFSSSHNSKVSVTENGIVTVAGDSPKDSTVLITASCGIYSTQLTVTTSAYEAFFWNKECYAESGRIDLDERIVWLEAQNNNLLSCSGSNGLTLAAYSSSSFNHEWRLLGAANYTKIQSVENGLFLTVQAQNQVEGSLISLSQPANTISQWFRFERMGNGNLYIITTCSSNYKFAIAYNSNTGQFYQTNRLNSNDLLTFRIREGGSSKLPSGFYSMGNPHVTTDPNSSTSYFYLSEGNGGPKLDFFSRTADYPRWLLMYKGKGYYSIINEHGQYELALTYINGNVSLDQVTGNDNQLWECATNSDWTHSFKAKGQNQYLMRDADNGSLAHPAIVDSSPASTEANWKMIQVTDSDALYNYGMVADVALVGIEDSTHNDSHLLWIAEDMDKLFNRQNTVTPLYYQTHTVKYLYPSATQTTPTEYYDVLKSSKFVIHYGHGQIDYGGSYLMLNPTSTGTASNDDVKFSASSITTDSLNNCDCIIFFSCKSAGFNAEDFSTSIVKKAKDGGAKYVIGCRGIGYCVDFEGFIDYIISNLEYKENSTTEYDYKKAFTEYGDYISSESIRTPTIFKDSDGLTAGGVN